MNSETPGSRSERGNHVQEQPKEQAVPLAENLLAVTLSAIGAVEEDDWLTAGQLLRRREQLLTQLERTTDLTDATLLLHRVQEAEMILLERMEQLTQSTSETLQTAQAVRHARKMYQSTEQGARLLERLG